MIFLLAAANTYCMDSIFRNLFLPVLVFTYSNASNFHMPVTYTLGVRCTHSQTDSDVTFSRSCDQETISKKD